MNPVVLQGMGEILEGLSALVRSQMGTMAMPKNEKRPLLEAGEMIVKARTMLSVALAAHIDNELNKSGD